MTALAVAPGLTAAEADLLAEAEATIERGIKTFVEVGQALAAVRDNRLYRASHGTFEEYAEQRWNLSRTRAYELMSAASVVSAIADTELPAPANEGQARALARVPEADRADVWRDTLDRTDGKPTAAAVAATWQERREPEADKAEPAVIPGAGNQDTSVVPAATQMPARQETADQALAVVDKHFARLAVEQALDEFLPPDPDSPHREWRINFLAAMAPTFRLLAGFSVDSVAEHADEECLDELERLARQVTSYRDRVRAACPIPNNVRHLRAV